MTATIINGVSFFLLIATLLWADWKITKGSNKIDQLICGLNSYDKQIKNRKGCK